MARRLLKDVLRTRRPASAGRCPMSNDDAIDIDGGAVNGDRGRRSARPWLTLALTIAASTFFCCGDPGEDVDTAESALTTTRTFNFGTAQWVLKRDCGQKCVKYMVGLILQSIRCQ